MPDNIKPVVMKRLITLKKYEIITISLVLFISLVFGVFSLYRIKQKKIVEIETILNTINKSCYEALKQWMNFRISNIEVLARNQYIVNSTIDLLMLDQDSATFVSSETTQKLREYFTPLLAANEDLGVFLIAPNYVSIFSMRNANTGSCNIMAVQSKSKLDRVLINGETLLITPIHSDVQINSKYADNASHTMFIVTPIRQNNKIIAAFSIRLDTYKDFSRILEVGKLLHTGETFGYDAQGKMITKSRFDANLVQMQKDKTKKLIKNISVFNPADYKQNKLENQLRIEELTKTKRSFNEMIDCRGIDVFATRIWDTELQMGITTKIDKKEALQEYYYVRGVLGVSYALLLISGFIVTIIIVNLRQKAENVLLTTNERLEKMVTNRTKELNQTIKTKDKFFSIVAHDLRSPFIGLIGLFDLIIKSPGTISDKKRDKMIIQIYEASTRLYKLLENLLSWARSQTHSVELEPENINLQGLINENMLLQKDQAKHKKIELANKSQENASVFVDRNTMDTVFRNLISNAIKFTPEKGRIWINTQIKNKTVEVIIEDNGVGMSQETLVKLFKVDTKVTTFGTNKERGTGLGLVLCKEFIKLNKGKITVNSNLGAGSQFIVELPLSEKDT